MVGWFYINDEVAAPVRMLETDEQSGVITVEVASRFVPNRTMLRGKTIIEYRHWPDRRLVRCLGAERVGNALMIEAVDVGPAKDESNGNPDPLGAAEDWLAINDRAYCRVTGLSVSDRRDSHCLFHVGLTDWRDLRIGENAPLASIGITLHATHDNDGSITPLLHSARELPLTLSPPTVEIVRLRERQRLAINPIATDWGDDTTLVVARVDLAAPLGKVAPSQTVIAHGHA
ncbi:MAG: hypothetical protein KTR15_11100 [Phycisphaeraceae bacterium]|nr:hypothetical protein [Phycisphaeraceae bacterium]